MYLGQVHRRDFVAMGIIRHRGILVCRQGIGHTHCNTPFLLMFGDVCDTNDEDTASAVIDNTNAYI